MVNITPTGTIMPTVETLSAGTDINRTSIKITGAIASLKFLDIKTIASAPNNAGNIWSNAGLKSAY